MSSLIFLKLPLHIIFDIFSRLPIKTLTSCRCVCKAFLGVLSDPDYALQNHKTTPNTLLIRESPQGYNPTLFYPHLYLVDLHESRCDAHPKNYFEVLPKYKIFSLPQFDEDPLQPIGSSNGLLCFYQAQSFRYSICNPLLGEYVVLPTPTPSPTPLENEEYTYLHYFGFCAKVHQYKLIRFISKSTRGSVVEVHTLGTKTWRRIGHTSWTISPRGSLEPFLNGILHLIISTSTHNLIIGSFDTEKERFGSVPSPSHFDSEYMKGVSSLNVGVYEGCVSICYVYAKSMFEMWVMNKYGYKNSWTKKFVVDYNVRQMHVGEYGYPLLFMENGEMWMMYRCLYLYKYNLKTGGVRIFDISGIDQGFEAITYAPSFVSINNAMTGNELNVEKSRKYSTMLEIGRQNECS